MFKSELLDFQGVYLQRNIDGESSKEDVVTSVVWWFVIPPRRKDPSDFYQTGSRWCFQTFFVFTPLGKDGLVLGKALVFCLLKTCRIRILF